jgi:hypothetical protein
MTTLNIDLDYIRTPDAVKEISNIELTSSYIQFVVTKAHHNLTGAQTRIFGRIQRKIDAAIEDKKTSIELEDAEADFIKSAFKDDKVQVPPQFAKYFVILMDEIENLGKDQ